MSTTPDTMKIQAPRFSLQTITPPLPMKDILEKVRRRTRSIADKLRTPPPTLEERLALLPRELRHKIYIMCTRNYWRQYIPLTAQVPSWYAHKLKVQHSLWEARQKNIHILHMDCNCLPENKEYIFGCGCDYCKNNPKGDIIIESIPKNIQDKFLTTWPLRNHYLESEPEVFRDQLWNYTDSVIGNNGFYDFGSLTVKGLKGNYDIYDVTKYTMWEKRDALYAVNHGIPLHFSSE